MTWPRNSISFFNQEHFCNFALSPVLPNDSILTQWLNIESFGRTGLNIEPCSSKWLNIESLSQYWVIWKNRAQGKVTEVFLVEERNRISRSRHQWFTKNLSIFTKSEELRKNSYKNCKRFTNIFKSYTLARKVYAKNGRNCKTFDRAYWITPKNYS